MVEVANLVMEAETGQEDLLDGVGLPLGAVGLGLQLTPCHNAGLLVQFLENISRNQRGGGGHI